MGQLAEPGQATLGGRTRDTLAQPGQGRLAFRSCRQPRYILSVRPCATLPAHRLSGRQRIAIPAASHKTRPTILSLSDAIHAATAGPAGLLERAAPLLLGISKTYFPPSQYSFAGSIDASNDQPRTILWHRDSCDANIPSTSTIDVGSGTAPGIRVPPPRPGSPTSSSNIGIVCIVS